jgi:hypothetical protein
MTFIEIMIVVLIMSLISGTGFFYLHTFLGNSELASEVKIFSQELDTFENQIKKYEILTYQIDLTPWNWGYSFTKNIAGNTYAQFQTVDFMTGSGIVSSVWAVNQDWKIKVFKDGKLQEETLYNSNTTPTISLKKGKNYTIFSYFAGVLSNTLWLSYFSEARAQPLPLCNCSAQKRRPHDSQRRKLGGIHENNIKLCIWWLSSFKI